MSDNKANIKQSCYNAIQKKASFNRSSAFLCTFIAALCDDGLIMAEKSSEFLYKQNYFRNKSICVWLIFRIIKYNVIIRIVNFTFSHYGTRDV